MPSWRRLLASCVACALSMAPLKAGRAMAARRAMMPMTTRSSIRVKARLLIRGGARDLKSYTPNPRIHTFFLFLLPFPPPPGAGVMPDSRGRLLFTSAFIRRIARPLFNLRRRWSIDRRRMSRSGRPRLFRHRRRPLQHRDGENQHEGEAEQDGRVGVRQPVVHLLDFIV